ncbi:MAG: DNA repair protein RecN [Oscillospiraceae bacterium]|jgi:DNA repair protein RecN (Recombination protein N)|nr:DNA repair protein RecN [Oscillospiraceae bacterium]
MLQSLSIENIALIKSVNLEFSDEPGFVVLTGETGAGKSILIDSIHAVLGERSSKDIIRTGAETARVSAVFCNISPQTTALLESLDLPCEEDQTLIAQRSMTISGKNSCRVNGVPVTVAVLRQIGKELIAIHGQHDTQTLLAQESHIQLIDAMANDPQLTQSYREAFLRLRKMQKNLQALQMDETEKERRLDALRHQIAELEEAAIVPGERRSLQERRALLLHAEKVSDALQSANDSLWGIDDAFGAVTMAHSAAEQLELAGEHYPQAKELADALRGTAFELEEHANTLRDLQNGVTFDPLESAEIEERLDCYYRLSRKYGNTEAEMQAFLERAIAEEASITQSDEIITSMQAEITAQRDCVITLSKRLTKARRQAAAAFCELVKEELAALDMPNVRLETRHEKVPLTPNGGDNMYFMISANVGEEPRPLAKIASGGELSRLMLAMKNVLAGKDTIRTLIFDEIDAGVSGRAAQKIGRKLAQVANGKQVICVTHLAQIAALADTHFFISKSTENDETITNVTALDKSGRVRELARIIGGENPTKAQLAAAAEMIG